MYYICLDIGGTSVKTAVTNENGTIFEQSSITIPKTLYEFTTSIFKYIKNTREKYSVSGIALSAPGSVDFKTGIIGGVSSIPYIHGPNWKKNLNTEFSLPVSIENDANCAALSEIYFGKYKFIKDMAFFVCGSGVGGAVIKDGKIHHGKHLHGGEFGFMFLDISCSEKKRFRNLSELGSTQALVRKVKKIYPDKNLDGKMIFEEAEKGDINCINAVDDFYNALAAGIINVQYIYDPEIIFMGGAVSNNNSFISGINKKVTEILDNMEQFYKLRPVIKAATYKKDANILGALAHHLQEYR
jgi:predicted NBD/HSP70 family sugar kinase